MLKLVRPPLQMFVWTGFARTVMVPGALGLPPAPALEPKPKTEQFIPRRYNEKTEPEADIPRGGKRGLDFALTLTPSDR